MEYSESEKSEFFPHKNRVTFFFLEKSGYVEIVFLARQSDSVKIVFLNHYFRSFSGSDFQYQAVFTQAFGVPGVPASLFLVYESCVIKNTSIFFLGEVTITDNYPQRRVKRTPIFL